MRCILTATLLATSLAGSAVASTHGHSDGDRRRKTLGFGPVLPHAVYNTQPSQAFGLASREVKSDPIEVARLFIKDLLRGRLSPGSTFEIREDSYTDANTGVTHVYARQMINTLEVVDGLINVNIKDGVVLSYGNSFYTGPEPDAFVTLPQDRHPQAEYCESLTSSMNEELYAGSSEQQPMKSVNKPFSTLQRLHLHNCDVPSIPDHPDHAGSPFAALLHFMAAAAPNAETYDNIVSASHDHLDNMALMTAFAPNSEDGVFKINGVPGAVEAVKTKMVYIQLPNDKGSSELVNAWNFEVQMEDNWYDATVSTESPYRIISVVDWASDSPIPTPSPKEHQPATYNVFAWGVNDPSESNRTLEKENYDSLASPVGWHSLPYDNDPIFSGKKPKGEFWHNTTTTYGNNVFAHEDWEGQNQWMDNYRPEAGANQSFDYKYDPKLTDKTGALEEAKKYINATVTQLFYTSNMVHDLYYRYGFDEVSGNFQQHNFGRGGKEDDGVIANAQDGSGYNNANFMTPPDGQNGRCRMYLWNTAAPYRDGDLEAGIVIHELSHGLSTRLTGGPARSSCLGWGESGGMGEGWGDFLATTIRSTSNYSDYPMGAWAANREGGIRNYIYSLNETVNPSTYKTLDKPGYWGVHAIGEVWAEILWIVSQKLIAKHGYSDNLFPPKPLENGTIPEGDFYRPAQFDAATGKKKPLIPKHGNTLITQLVLNGMKLQPCMPSFFDARDAIIQSDQVLTGGENYCTLWKGFSERGLGPDARVDGRTPWGGGIRTNDYDVPSACQ